MFEENVETWAEFGAGGLISKARGGDSPTFVSQVTLGRSSFCSRGKLLFMG